MAVNQDYYSALGVERSATKKEIQSAFRKLARKYHPDVNHGDKQAEGRFKEVSEAHGVLSDPKKRALYDRFGSDWQAAAAAPEGTLNRPRRGPRPSPQGNYQEVDPSRFADLFGSDLGSVFGFAGAGRRARPAEAQAEIVVSLREAYLGTTRQATLPDGHTLEVTVPAGVAEGTTLRVPGLRVLVRIAPDAEFEREGKDLRAAVAVPLRTALLGGEVEVPTPKGGRVHLRIPEQTQNGTRLRLRGLGMPDAKGGAPGDLYAEVRVRLPVPLDDATRAWASQIPD
ncbi:MAG TPA: J domain-containing protein [Candidatus Acidoferrales bacterium]|nr:J domain-containing protein [Candidatus Acidoferrales bacterium]